MGCCSGEAYTGPLGRRGHFGNNSAQAKAMISAAQNIGPRMLVSHMATRLILAIMGCFRNTAALRRGDHRVGEGGRDPRRAEHRRAKYLNNRLEGDHGKLKRLIRPTLGFQSMRTARATIKGFEVMRMFKKGQFRFWIEAVVARTAVSFINHLFGLYA